MSSTNKKLIFNSDDFGHSHAHNIGIYKGLKSGLLTTSCVLANTEGYREAVDLICDLKGVKFGIHLNLIEGKSISQSNLLCDSKGNFNNGYTGLFRKSFNKDFMEEIEIEFRTQIEKIMGDFEINHINSHIHIHSIPNIFKLTCKLAQEYKIPYIRTQYEIPYYAKLIRPINIVKSGLLNSLSINNKKYLGTLKTNDYLIGVMYTGHMDKRTVLKGLKKINNGITEILIHPAYYEKKVLKPDNYQEFLMTQETGLIEEIKKLGFEFCDCSLSTPSFLKEHSFL